jgi:Ca-activated chloride channel homolog
MAFDTPLALVSLVVVPALLVSVRLLSGRARRGVAAFTNLTVLEAVGRRRRSRRRLLPATLAVLALACTAIATAQPTVPLPALVNNATIVLLVDVSGSMSARDVEPTRLDAAVAAMRGFLAELPKSMQVGLVQFSDTAQVLAAPTEDRARITQTLGLLDAESGTAIGAGMLKALELIRSSLAARGVVHRPGHDLPGAIVLLSDGKQTQNGVEPLQAAARARAAGVRIDTVALGTPHGIIGFGPYAPKVAPDPPLMRAIAGVTGGRTATARNEAELATFYRGVGSSFGHTTRPHEVAGWFLAAAAVFLMAAVGAGRVLAGPLM